MERHSIDWSSAAVAESRTLEVRLDSEPSAEWHAAFNEVAGRHYRAELERAIREKDHYRRWGESVSRGSSITVAEVSPDAVEELRAHLNGLLGDATDEAERRRRLREEREQAEVERKRAADETARDMTERFRSTDA